MQTPFATARPVPGTAQSARAIIASALLAGLVLADRPATAAEEATANAAASAVSVSFVKADEYTDIGRGGFDRKQNLRALETHFKQLGKRLSPGQQLQVDVLDVDLAGELRPHLPHELRVLRGGVDWPRMTLRYTLKAGETTLAQGEERLSDPAYMFTRRQLVEHQPLPYERRMLESWFSTRFASQLAAAAH